MRRRCRKRTGIKKVTFASGNANEADAVERFDGILEGLRDVWLWLGNGRFGDRLLELYPRDTATFAYLSNLEKVCDGLLEPEGEEAAADPGKVASIMRAGITNLIEKLEAEPCRLFWTWDILLTALRRTGGDPELSARITSGRMAAVEHHQALRASARDVTADIHLDGWIHQRAIDAE